MFIVAKCELKYFKGFTRFMIVLERIPTFMVTNVLFEIFQGVLLDRYISCQPATTWFAAIKTAYHCTDGRKSVVSHFISEKGTGHDLSLGQNGGWWLTFKIARCALLDELRPGLGSPALPSVRTDD